MKNGSHGLLSIAIFVSLVLALGPGASASSAAITWVSELAHPALSAPFLTASAAEAASSSADHTTDPAADASAALGSTPVMFIENVGQFAESARFKVHAGARTMWLAEDAIWVTVAERAPSERLPFHDVEAETGALGPSRLEGDGDSAGVNLRLSFVGANPDAVVEPFDQLGISVNYFVGSDPTGWWTEVPVYGGVRYVDVYPGVDLELTGEAGRWAWRMVLNGTESEPSFDDVGLRVEGAQTVELLSAVDGGQALSLTTTAGDLILPLLQAVETDGSSLIRDGEGPRVTGDEVVAPFSSHVLHRASDSLLADQSHDLLYSTFLGGSDEDAANSIAVDEDGAAYVTGRSSSSDFPTSPGAFDTTHGGSTDAFVVKLKPDGSGLAYATYLGGSEEDEGWGITVGGDGAAYVIGETESADFPTTMGAFDRSHNGEADAFLVKLCSSGSALVYATFLGGSSNDRGRGIAVDEDGAAYVTGETHSSDLPTTLGAFDRSFNGSTGYVADAFVMKLNPTGSDLAYATFLGGYGWDVGWDLAVDGGGAAYVTGGTASFNFPVTSGAFDTSLNHGYDVFVAKLNPTGSHLAYATFLGGSDHASARGIAVDAEGAAYVTGTTRAYDFPITPGAFDPSFNGNSDVFVVKLNQDGSGLAYSSFLGGSNWDEGYGIAVDGDGAVYLTGETRSHDFPNSYDEMPYSRDAFVANLSPDGSDLVYATFLGGSLADYGRDIAVDAHGVAYVTGQTSSYDFPTTPGAYDTTYNGNGNADAFVSVVDSGALCYWADVNCDGKVDIEDIQLVAGAWRCAVGDLCYDPRYDVDNDDIITVIDIMMVASEWGWPDL